MRSSFAPWAVLALSMAGCSGGGSGGSSAANPQTGVPAPEPSTYSVGGTVTGLTSGGLILQNNAVADLTVQADGPYSFPASLSTGASYQVTVRTNPPSQTCVVGNASGNIANANVTNVAISCSALAPGGEGGGGTPRVTIGGTIAGLTLDGLVLRLGTEDLAIAANSASFVFATALVQNSSYDVSVAHQPQSQTCLLSGGTGQVANAAITTVSVTCSDNSPSAIFTLDKSALTFVAEEGEHIGSQSIVGTVTGTTEPVFVSVTSTYNGVWYAELMEHTGYSGRIEVAARHSYWVAPGTYNDTITIKVCFDTLCDREVAGSPRQVPVTYTVTRTPLPVMQLSDYAVAFASVPHATQLTRSISVSDASGASSTWTATTSAAPWLAVTPAGTSGSSMTLTANPAGLAEGFHEALVTVRSSNPEITQDATLRVGLYKSTAGSAATLAQMPPTPDYLVPAPQTASVSDPLRPILYSIAGTQVSIDHFHSGAHLGDLAISNAISIATSRDGSRLYVLKSTPQIGVVVVNLDTRQVINSYELPAEYSLDGPLSNLRLTSAQVGGRSVLILNGVRVPVNDSEASIVPFMDADTGQVLGEMHYASSELRSLFAVSRDSRALYSTETGLSGNLSIDRFELRANIVGNVYAKLIAQSPPISVAGSSEIATSNDGSKAYVAYADGLGRIRGFAATPGGVALAPAIEFDLPPNVLDVGVSPRNVEFDAYGKLIADLHTFDFRVYGANGVLLEHATNLANASIGSAATGTLRISSDGLRAVGNGYLVNLPP